MKILLLFACLLTSSCTTASEKSSAFNSISEKIACEDPRPQICTREYNPVCATYNDGSKKTAATGCTACSDSEVTGYITGACEITKSD